MFFYPTFFAENLSSPNERVLWKSFRESVKNSLVKHFPPLFGPTLWLNTLVKHDRQFLKFNCRVTSIYVSNPCLVTFSPVHSVVSRPPGGTTPGSHHRGTTAWTYEGTGRYTPPDLPPTLISPRRDGATTTTVQVAIHRSKKHSKSRWVSRPHPHVHTLWSMLGVLFPSWKCIFFRAVRDWFLRPTTEKRKDEQIIDKVTLPKRKKSTFLLERTQTSS